MELNNTAHKLLDAAEAFTQTRGFNAFSYKDLEKEVGIRTASIHYYFPTKGDLAFHMADRYLVHFRSKLESMSSKHAQGIDRLNGLGDAFVSTLSEGKFCVCLMLSTEHLSLPEGVLGKVKEFFSITETWLSQSITLAQEQGSLNPKVSASDLAAQLLAVLEGGMVIALARNEPEQLGKLLQKALAPWTV